MLNSKKTKNDQTISKVVPFIRNAICSNKTPQAFLNEIKVVFSLIIFVGLVIIFVVTQHLPKF